MSRLKIIEKLIHVNESIIFYPRLKKYYIKKIKVASPIIFDIGVNKGQSIEFFLNIYPRCIIYGFEPNKQIFQFLSEKYKGNKNIKLFNYGISSQTGKLLFHETIIDATSTFEDLNFDSSYLKFKSKVLGVKPNQIIKSSYEVDVINLHDFIKQQGIGNIDVIKIDTEGHEYKCLLGLFKDKSEHNISFIQLEHHKDDMYKNKISDDLISGLLKKNGFLLDKNIKHGFGDFEEVIYTHENDS